MTYIQRFTWQEDGDILPWTPTPEEYEAWKEREIAMAMENLMLGGGVYLHSLHTLAEARKRLSNGR